MSRICYFLAALTTLITGLLSRSLGLDKTHFIVSHVGDILWAAFIYYLVRLIQPKLRSEASALFAAVFCLAIEFQQLYQAEWLLELRSNKILALVLGHSYSTADLLCYTSGIVLALLLDNLCVKG
jgi:hypothetical protein